MVFLMQISLEKLRVDFGCLISSMDEGKIREIKTIDKVLLSF